MSAVATGTLMTHEGPQTANVRAMKRSGKAVPLLLLSGILLLALFIRLDHFSARWLDYNFVPTHLGDVGWSGAFYSTIGRNYLRYGFSTSLGPVISTGFVASDRLSFYPNHPPLLGWFLAMSFAVFGEHEWAARLVPLLFSLGSLVVLYALAMRYFGVPVGLLATLLMAVVPISAYYLGAFPDVQGPHVLFFILLSLWCYFRWLESGQRSYFVSLALAVYFGILADWPGAYTPVILAAYHWFTQSRNKLRPVLVLLATSMIMVLLLIWYLSWLVHDPWKIPKAFLNWSVVSTSESVSMTGRLSAVLGWITTICFGQVLPLYTPLLLSLVAAHFIMNRHHGDTSQAPHGPHVVWMLLVFGALHIALGLRGASKHDYWSIYLTPGFVIAAALWIIHLSDERFRLAVRSSPIPLLVVSALGFIGLGHVAHGLDWRVSAGYFLATTLFGLAPFISLRLLWRMLDIAGIAITLGVVSFTLAAYGQTRMMGLADNRGGGVRSLPSG